MYKTEDGAITWTEHVLPTEESGTADTWNAEEAQVDTDTESNVYAMWMGIDNLPYFSYSTDPVSYTHLRAHETADTSEKMVMDCGTDIFP